MGKAGGSPLLAGDARYCLCQGEASTRLCSLPTVSWKGLDKQGQSPGVLCEAAPPPFPVLGNLGCKLHHLFLISADSLALFMLLIYSSI